MMNLLHAIDRAGGYAFGGAEGANDTVWQVAVRQNETTMSIDDVQERWLDAKGEWDEKERREWAEEAKKRDAFEAAGGGHGTNDNRGNGEGDDGFDLDQMSGQIPDGGVKVVRKQ